jgi:hypothetical protein
MIPAAEGDIATAAVNLPFFAGTITAAVCCKDRN